MARLTQVEERANRGEFGEAGLIPVAFEIDSQDGQDREVVNIDTDQWELVSFHCTFPNPP